MKNENQIRNKRTFDIFGYEVSIENNTQFHKSIKNKNKIIKQMKIIFIQLFAQPELQVNHMGVTPTYLSRFHKANDKPIDR